MNRIDTRFAALRGAGRKALIPFITCGDPSLEATVPVMHALVEGGADVIELGMPFSDPMADGPVIQRSSERALSRGAGTRHVMACVREFRSTDAHTPIVLMGYLNPIEMRGPEVFAHEAADAGVDGLLLVDLPPEEAAGHREVFNRAGLALIPLAAPTTSDARRDRMAAEAQGYVYYVSFAGVTGGAQLDTKAVRAPVHALRERARVPVVVGFGVRDAASAAALAPMADGVVVGSALVDVLSRAGTAGEAADAAREFMQPLRQALDEAPRD
ncbi:tryptophan synthase subunit alpha [Alkalisalibacterium limincola]|uniref:Tryptophan synthase alpha chain n=1 Tax=Alkalisalibacterium limincola TaxID=2699169 RepID=A0A5C8KMZ9_9GAMM|nr:tryptophan synthase subunit alpha [Alkalisalibacterium limincola]TXK62023.1 tryptophan synthase subunit alpha [Alkalisalibacterium limincola]